MQLITNCNVHVFDPNPAVHVPLLHNYSDSTYQSYTPTTLNIHVPSFNGVNGVLDSSVISITSYTITIYISSVLLKGKFNRCTSIYY